MSFEQASVFLGMSGGVDSSVAALLLTRAGYRVHGVHLRMWSSHGQVAKAEQAIERFEAVCRLLGVSYEVLDYRVSFQSLVIEHYFAELRAGRTPNPCVRCNRLIKWGMLLDYARSKGADYLSSGHYAILKRDSAGVMRLYKAKDPGKDQSYFLSALSQETFRYMLFPLGDYLKGEVRDIAIGAGLPDFSEVESQDLCFLEAGGQEEFLKRYAPNMLLPGPIRNLAGDLLGKHIGLPLYTIGQRKGIQVAAGEPYYVVAKDVASNTLIVDISARLYRDTIYASDVNWVSGSAADLSKKYQVKIRSGARPVDCCCEITRKGDIIVKLDKPLRDITAGQRLVIYDGELCLGSAEIVRAADNQCVEAD